MRVRFAPSPTGHLHIGSARTFIFNWLYARRHGGTMVLRIDDTDVDRNTEESLQSIYDGLNWLGLGWDDRAWLGNPGSAGWLNRTVDVIRSRFSTLEDFPTRGRAHFSDDFTIEPAALEKLDQPGARALLGELAERLAAISEFTEQAVEAELRRLSVERGVKAGLIINAARAALSGQSVGPSAFAVFGVIGRARSIARLRRAAGDNQ